MIIIDSTQQTKNDRENLVSLAVHHLAGNSIDHAEVLLERSFVAPLVDAKIISYYIDANSSAYRKVDPYNSRGSWVEVEYTKLVKGQPVQVVEVWPFTMIYIKK